MSKTTTMTCPHCSSRLTIDLEAGVIVAHEAPPSDSTKIDFDKQLKQVAQEKDRASERMAEAMRREQSKDKILEDRFQQLMDDAKTKPITGKPIKDIDL